MIYDLFPFFNELELLELRLHTLNDYVDKFVLLESTKTFTGNDKKLYYDLNKDSEYLKPFRDKIIHLVCDTDPPHILPGDTIEELKQNAWARDFYQKEQLAQVILNGNGSDVFLLSDLDEIPNPSTLEEVWSMNSMPAVMMQSLHFYHINWLRPPEYWHGTMIFDKQFFVNQVKSIRATREHRYAYYQVGNGGWHFSTIGGARRAAYKMKSFAHVECDVHGDMTETEAKLEESFKEALDAYDPSVKMRVKKYKASDYPKYMSTILERCPHWVKE